MLSKSTNTMPKIFFSKQESIRNKKKPVLMNFLKPICAGGCQTYTATGTTQDIKWDPD